MKEDSVRDSSLVPVFLTTVLSAGLLFWASYYPTQRVWGLAVWAYLDVWIRLLLVGGLIAVTAIALWHRVSAFDSGEDGNRSQWPFLLSLTAGSCLLFYLLRTEVHFLGDGYFLLKSLASDNPLLRSRNFGEMLFHKWIRNLLPLERKAAALATFRMVSIGAGVLHAALVAWLGPRLVGNREQGRQFALGMMTGGYALLYFGYVENYSLFGLAVAVYTYVGILIAMERVQRGWIIAAFAGVVFFHALGLVLVLPTLYLLLIRTPISRKLDRLHPAAKAGVVAVIFLTLCGMVYFLSARSLFFRFALVPWPGDSQVLEGYSLFSLPHFADLANLLFLLAPAILVLTVAQLGGRRDQILRDPRVHFLAVTAMCALGGAFLFEAKLGMPRDWDLFSFVGYPVMALLLLGITVALPRKLASRAMLAAVLVGQVCLVPRVITAHTPERGIQQFRDYADIDVRKNRSGWYVLLQYYSERADSAGVRSVGDLRVRRFPEEAMARAADSALMRGSIDSAMLFDLQAIRLNPTYASSWGNLGSCLLDKGQNDSAVLALEIATALNPDSPRGVSYLGLAYLFAGQYDKAEAAFLDAYQLDTTLFEPVMSLARLYQETGDKDKYIEWLAKAAYRKEAEGIWATELGDAYLQRGNVDGAGRAFQEALRRGSDTATIMQRLEAHPELKSFIRP